MKKKEKKHLLYNLFNPQGKDLEVPKEDLEGPENISKCFKILGRNVTNLLTLNLFIIFGNFPLMFGLLALTGNLSSPTTAASSSLFAPLFGVMKFDASPVTQALFGVHGIQSSIYTPTVWTYVFLALSLLVLFTNGFVSVGVNYVLRSMVRRDPVSLWSDFWGAIKRNKKQGLIMGALDVLIIGILFYDIYFFAINASAMMYVNLIILALYIIMRFYIYILLITFDLNIWKILKNSLIFTLLNFKRNITALIGILLAAALTWILFIYFIPAGVILGITFLFSVSMYFGAYAAYPKIKEIMIDPQINNK
ncbi:MAG: DUF624 domain-containing protein [Clostridia bacterium]|nr:DUF624 domain-containing protein [Clostridia bacterium]